MKVFDFDSEGPEQEKYLLFKEKGYLYIINETVAPKMREAKGIQRRYLADIVINIDNWLVEKNRHSF